MIQFTSAVLNQFGRRLRGWPRRLRISGVWLPMFAAFSFTLGCSSEWGYHRDEREAVAQRSTLPASQQEALAELKDCIPEYVFIYRVTIRDGTVTEVTLDPNVRDLHLAAVGRLPDLEVLYCSGGHVTDAGLIHLKTLRKLRVIGLPHSVSGPGLGHLKDLPDLREVDFWNGDGFTDEAMMYLSHLKNLETIRVHHAPISDEGLKHLTSLKNLRHLDIGWCDRITDEGLSQLKDCSSLRELNVTETGITQAAVAHFRRARPECEVITEFKPRYRD